jgi:hypothetical protein
MLITSGELMAILLGVPFAAALAAFAGWWFVERWWFPARVRARAPALYAKLMPGTHTSEPLHVTPAMLRYMRDTGDDLGDPGLRRLRWLARALPLVAVGGWITTIVLAAAMFAILAVTR